MCNGVGFRNAVVAPPITYPKVWLFLLNRPAPRETASFPRTPFGATGWHIHTQECALPVKVCKRQTPGETNLTDLRVRDGSP
jgi:hypothetical protein